MPLGFSWLAGALGLPAVSYHNADQAYIDEERQEQDFFDRQVWCEDIQSKHVAWIGCEDSEYNAGDIPDEKEAHTNEECDDRGMLGAA